MIFFLNIGLIQVNCILSRQIESICVHFDSLKLSVNQSQPHTKLKNQLY